MSKFTDTLSIKESISGDYFILNEPLIWKVDDVNSNKSIIVPKDYISDGASVPFDVFGLRWRRTIRRPAILHDYLYWNIKKKTPNEYAKTRKEADGIFLNALIVCGTNKLIAYTMWFFVRIFGGYAIRMKSKQDEINGE